MERRPIERVRGTQDLWSDEARQLDAIQHRLEAVYRAFGYARIDVPVLEQTELHMRKSGLEIVAKLYAFEDQGGRRLCLRPELTASIARAFVSQRPPRLPVKLFTSGPVFRYERPSRGRYRQFTQSGVELVGAEGAPADAEVIQVALQALEALGLSDYQVTIGHIGILSALLAQLGLNSRLRAFLLDGVETARRRGVAAVRERLAEIDPDVFAPRAAAEDPIAAAFDESQARRVIDGLFAEMGSAAFGRRSHEDVVSRTLEKLRPSGAGQAIERVLAFVERLGSLAGEPAEVLDAGRALLAEFGLSHEPLRELEAIVELLAASGAPMDRVRLDLGLSRGLQYYTGTVFEIDHDGMGSESQLCGGGRYDDLIRALGARQAVPALGFAFGVERLRLALEIEGLTARLNAGAEPAGVFLIPATPEARPYAHRAAQALRLLGVHVDLEVAGRPLRAGLAYADHAGFAHVAIVGPDDAACQTVRLRNMASGVEQTASLADVPALLAGRAPAPEVLTNV